jgi:hypothetical protein
MIENGFVYAVNMSLEKKRKREARKAVKEQKLREILIRKNLQLAINAVRADFNKTELTLIESLGYMEYLIMNEKYSKKKKKD